MTKHRKAFVDIKIIELIVTAGIILLILFAGVFVFRFFKINSYFIENKYYGFKLQTPKNWVALEKTAYSDGNIPSLLAQCKNNKLNSEIGAFRFEDQKYPEHFGDAGYLPVGLSSGAILEVTVNCVPDISKTKMTSDNFLNLPVFGKTKQLSILHNNLQYKINEYIYVSPSDKASEDKIKENYTGIFNKIIASLNFIK